MLYALQPENLDSVPEQDLMDIYQSILDGADKPAESFGFDAPAMNAVEDMALAYYRAKRFDQAAPLYGFLLQLDLERASAWRGLGACAQGVKNYDLAVICYDEAVIRAPDDLVSKTLLGECLCHLGNKVGGVRVLNEVVDAGGKNASEKLYVSRARIIVGAGGGIPTPVVLRNQGKDVAREAAQALTEATAGLEFDEERDVEWGDIQKNPELMANIKELVNAVDSGTLSLADVGGFTENELDGAYACACKYAEMGQTLQAIQIAGYLVFLSPQEARYYQLLGICLQRMNQWDGAEYFYRTALLFEPEDPMTHVYRGEAQIMAGKRNEGIDSVKKGADLARTDEVGNKGLLDRAAVLIQQFGG